MADSDFDEALNALYARRQVFSDERQFAASLERRLLRRRNLRAVVLGALGAAGALVTFWWLVTTRLLGYLREMVLPAFGSTDDRGFFALVAMSSLTLTALAIRSVLDNRRY